MAKPKKEFDLVSSPKRVVKRDVAPAYTPKELAVIRLANMAGLKIEPIRTEQLNALAQFAHLAIKQEIEDHPKPLSPFVSRDELVAAIKAATRKKEVCTPSRDYYRRSDEWSTEDIEYIDSDELIHILTNPEN